MIILLSGTGSKLGAAVDMDGVAGDPPGVVGSEQTYAPG
jgi:hypothetical protein